VQNVATRTPTLAQATDALGVALRSGKPIQTNFLALWTKPDIPDPCDGHKVVRTTGGRYSVVLRDWRKSELALKERFGGILLSYTAREQVKRQAPHDDAPLFDWVMYVLNVVWALHSRAVFLEGDRRPFEKYLRDALLNEPRFDHFQLTEAAQALRLSLGLPRFRPTSPPLPPLHAGGVRGRR
jgi:hypothetical protein